VLASGTALGPDLLPDQISQNGARVPPRALLPGNLEGRSLFEITEAYERRVILDMLAQTNWSQTEAAERFKIPLSTLNQKIRRLQIEVKRRREEP
jgi:DNA-binding NtrC family response regulator